MSDFFCECGDSGEPPCAGLVQLRADLAAANARLAECLRHADEMAEVIGGGSFHNAECYHAFRAFRDSLKEPTK